MEIIMNNITQKTLLALCMLSGLLVVALDESRNLEKTNSVALNPFESVGYYKNNIRKRPNPFLPTAFLTSSNQMGQNSSAVSHNKTEDKSKEEKKKAKAYKKACAKAAQEKVKEEMEKEIQSGAFYENPGVRNAMEKARQDQLQKLAKEKAKEQYPTIKQPSTKPNALASNSTLNDGDIGCTFESPCCAVNCTLKTSKCSIQ